MAAEINGRPPKKVWETIFYTGKMGFSTRIEAYVLAVSKEKAEAVIIKRYPRATILTMVYYGEIYK